MSTERVRSDYWVIREGTRRGHGRYFWFSPGASGEMAKAAWSSVQGVADKFDSWEEAQDEVCNVGAVCRAVRVIHFVDVPAERGGHQVSGGQR